MLKKELIQSNEALKDLSDDQISAIEALSKNDEQEVLNKRIGEIHGQYDKDIQEITGKEKPQGVKTYEHLKTVLGDFKTRVDSMGEKESEIKTLKTTISDLNKKIKDGNTDEHLKTELENARSELKNVQDTYSKEKEEWQKQLSEKDKSLSSFKQRSVLEKAVASFKYKPEDIIPGEVRNQFTSNAISQILEEFEITEEDGKMVFKKDGQIVRDKDDNLNPMSPEKMLKTRLKSIIEEGTPGGGGGGKPPKPGGKITIKTARNRVEAEELIEKALLAAGKVKGTDEFQTEKDKLYKENEVSKLPFK